MDGEKDKIFKELYFPLEGLASEEEDCELQEIARGLICMEKAEPSSSFREELKSCLLQGAPLHQAGVKADQISASWLGRLCQGFMEPAKRFRFSATFAAAAVFILVLAVFSHQLLNPPAGKMADPQPPAHESHTYLNEGGAGNGEKTSSGEQPGPGKSGEHPSAGEDGIEEHAPGELQVPPSNSGGPSNSGVGEGDGTGVQGGEAVPQESEGSGLNEPSIPEKPKFQTEGDMHDLYLAGAVIISPLYVGGAGEENPPYNDFPTTLRPNGKFVIAAPEDAATFGSKAWAGGLLKNQGFVVRSGDSLEITAQETLEGSFAEIFYQPGGKGSQHPVLILRCKEPGTILGYYYREKGTYNEAGCYPLLTPAQALKAQQLTVFSSSKPSLIFTEVRIEFSDFLLDDGKAQQNVTLPAYCFTGMDTVTDSEIKICLPAVSR